MKHKLLKDEDIVIDRSEKRGRGRIKFPEFLDLEISKNGEKADLLIYPDTPYNRKELVMGKNVANRGLGVFGGRRFTHRYEVRGGEPCIIIQRVL